MARLTSRKVQFVNSLKQGKTQTQAAIDAGYAPTAAANLGNRLAHDPEIQNMLAKEFEQYGLTRSEFLEGIKAGSLAMKIEDHQELPDYDCRHKFLMTWGKMLGWVREVPESLTQVNLFGSYFDQAYKEYCNRKQTQISS